MSVLPNMHHCLPNLDLWNTNKDAKKYIFFSHYIYIYLWLSVLSVKMNWIVVLFLERFHELPADWQMRPSALGSTKAPYTYIALACCKLKWFQKEIMRSSVRKSSSPTMREQLSFISLFLFYWVSSQCAGMEPSVTCQYHWTWPHSLFQLAIFSDHIFTCPFLHHIFSLYCVITSFLPKSHPSTQLRHEWTAWGR